jgi:hypothetical protein
MTAIDTVKTFMTALQSGDFELAAREMDDDFTMTGFADRDLDQGAFLALQSALHAAMPDLSYGLSELEERGSEVVTGLMQVTGTQTQDLTLPDTATPMIPATGLAVELPQVHVRFGVRAGKVRKMDMESLPGSGLSGLLQQIGTELPVASRLGTDDIKRLNEEGETSI